MASQNIYMTAWLQNTNTGGMFNPPTHYSTNVGIAQTHQSLRNGKHISLYNNLLFIFKGFHDEQHTQ